MILIEFRKGNSSVINLFSKGRMEFSIEVSVTQVPQKEKCKLMRV
jgi:hypothetical protein